MILIASPVAFLVKDPARLLTVREESITEVGVLMDLKGIHAGSTGFYQGRDQVQLIKADAAILQDLLSQVGEAILCGNGVGQSVLGALDMGRACLDVLIDLSVAHMSLVGGKDGEWSGDQDGGGCSAEGEELLGEFHRRKNMVDQYQKQLLLLNF